MHGTRPDDADFHATGHVSAYDAPPDGADPGVEERGHSPAPPARPSTRTTIGRLTAFVGLATFAVIVAPALLYPFLQAAGEITGTRLIAYGAMSCAGLLVATAITVRWFGESWNDGTRLGAASLGVWPVAGGLAAGWFAISVPTGLLLWFGALRMVPAEPGSWGDAAALALLMLAPAALMEELTVRGYAFTLLQRRWGASVAVVATSVVFGLLHLLNPGVSAQAIVMVVLAGFFLAIVRLAFDSLWAAWLAHFAFNFVQLAVFHTAVSGLALPQPHYQTIAVGPAWLTGGEWGPEAGAAAALGLLGVSFVLAISAGWVRVQRRGWRLGITGRPGGRRES